MAINETTRQRLQAFAESDKFRMLQPQTQERLMSVLGGESPTTTVNQTEPNINQGGIQGQVTPESSAGMQHQNLLGKTFNVPGAAMRGGIQSAYEGEGFGSGYKQGALTPDAVPRFQDLAIQKAQDLATNRMIEGMPEEGFMSPSSRSGQMALTAQAATAGLPASVAGFAADRITNPAELLLLIMGKTPLGKGRSLGSQVGKTKVAKSLSKFMGKNREAGVPGRGLVRRYKAGREAVEDIKKGKEALKALKYKGGLKIEESTARANAASVKMNQDIDDLSALLNREIETSAGTLSKDAQVATKKIINENSKIYGNKLDEVVDGLLPKQKQLSNRQNVSRIIDESIAEAQAAFIDEGTGINILNKMKEKYGIARGEGGRFTNQQVDLRTVLSDLKNAKKAMSAGKLAPEEIPIEIFRKNIGSFIENDMGVKGISEMNQSYRPIMDLQKEAGAIFKPYKGPMGRKSGERFMRRALTPDETIARTGKEGLLQTEKEMFNKLKEGHEGWAKGIGDIDSSAQKAINAIQKRIDTAKSAGANISKSESQYATKIRRVLKDAARKNQISQQELETIVRGGKDAEKVIKKILKVMGGLALLTSGGSAIKRWAGGYGE